MVAVIAFDPTTILNRSRAVLDLQTPMLTMTTERSCLQLRQRQRRWRWWWWWRQPCESQEDPSCVPSLYRDDRTATTALREAHRYETQQTSHSHRYTNDDPKRRPNPTAPSADPPPPPPVFPPLPTAVPVCFFFSIAFAFARRF